MRSILVLMVALATMAGCASNGGPLVPGDGSTGDGGDGGNGTCTNDTDCTDDEIFCNGGLVCVEGECQASGIPTCGDGVGCTRDECNTMTDMCENTPVNSSCPDGTVCMVGEGCAVMPACEFDSDCLGDGIFCNGVEVCVMGLCQSPMSGLACDDSNSCTMDVCNETMGDCASTVFPDIDTNPMHCGTGADDCVVCPEPDPALRQVAVCVDGGCLVVCAEGYIDADGDMSNGCEFMCVVMGGVDQPDDAFVDGNCDGIDGDRPLAIFLSTVGSDSNDGLTTTTPVASFGQAFTVHAANPSRVQILVANGLYASSTTLTLPDGIGVYGGYSDDFLTRTDSRASLTASSPTAIRASGLRSPTVVDRINVTTASRTAAGEPTMAMIVADSLDRLSLRFLSITAGRGGDGSVGGTGGPGAPGDVGSPAIGSTGGGGGDPGGGGALGRGGAGTNGRRQASGLPGQIGSAGSCGSGGPAGIGSGTGGLGCGDGDPGPGGGGDLGCTGTVGGAVPGGDDTGTLTGEIWTPSDGSPGILGGVGGGGGGGGAGGGEDCEACLLGGCSCLYCGTGRGGGGGGGGGQGGGGGVGGTGGGASIGLLLISSTVVAQQLRIQTSSGGNGGVGGPGGAGGGGRSGGAGATSSSSTEGSGGRGGRGGDGGRGGCGGGGGGGPSVAVWGNGTSARVREVSPVSYAPGAGGGGGTSCGTGGLAGISANLREAFPE